MHIELSVTFVFEGVIALQTQTNWTHYVCLSSTLTIQGQIFSFL